MTIQPNICSDLAWTGERYVPNIKGLVALEHLHRYAYACQFVTGKVVLDIACGEGYGTEMLSRTALHAYGVDIDQTTVAHAREKYGSDRINFLVGSFEKIPLPDHSVDVVVSFETIEHTDRHVEAICEIKRVLRPEGFLVISSPNKEVYDFQRADPNPFHIKELSFKDFEDLLQANFKHIKIWGQSVLQGSFVVEPRKPTSFGSRFEFQELPDNIGNQNGLPAPVYLIAICSDRKLQPSQGSFCEWKVFDTEEFQDAIQKLTRLQKELEKLLLENNALMTERSTLDSERESLASRLSTLESQNITLVEEREALTADKSALDSRLSTLESEREALAVRLDDRFRELALLTKEFLSAQDNLETLESEKSTLAIERDELATEREALTSLLSDRFDEITRLGQRILTLESEGDRRVAEIQARMEAMEARWTWKLGAPARWVWDKVFFLALTLLRLPVALRILFKHRQSGFFDHAWYFRKNPDVQAATTRPFLHFAFHGVYENRPPHAAFNEQKYLQRHPEAKSSGRPPLLHYTLHGWQPPVVAAVYDRRNPRGL